MVRMTYRSIWRRRSADFARGLRAVLRDPADVDAVHDARVAGRRLIAVANAWIGKRPKWILKIVKRLGCLRNLDVAIGHARKLGGPAKLVRDLERRRAECGFRAPRLRDVDAPDRRPDPRDLDPVIDAIRSTRELHDLRREIRLLRYGLEIMPRPKHLEILHELQDLAGDCRDLEILAHRARKHRKFHRELRKRSREAERAFRERVPELLRRLS